MKFILPLFILLTFSGFCQQIKVDISGGYSQGFTSYSTYAYTEYYSALEYRETLKAKQIRLGNGWLGRLGMSYMFNDQLFINLTGLYFKSGNIGFMLEDQDYDYSSGFAEEYHSDLKLQNESFYLQMGLGMHRALGDKFSLEMSAGPSFRAFGKLTEQQNTEYIFTSPIPNQSSTSTSETITEYTPSLELGGYGDVAVFFNLTERLELFANATLRLSTYSNQLSKMTSAKSDGVEEIEDYSTNQTETEYVTYTSNEPYDENKPYQALKSWESQSSMQYALGLRYGFGSAPEEAAEASGKRGFYVSLLGGYGFPLAAGNLVNTNWMNDSSEPMSYGSGMNLSLLAGYSLANGIAFELGGMYNQAAVKSFYGWGTSYDNYTNKSKMARITIGAKLEGDAKIVNPFVRAGLALGVYNNLTFIRESEYSGGNGIDEFEFTGNVSVGGYAGLGVSFKVANFMQIVAEGLINVQNWTPTKAENTRSEFNGVNELEGSTVSELEYELVDEITYSSNDPDPDPDSPSKALKQTFPFSSAVFRLGVRFDLRK